jgi:hypothetical protein
VESLKNHINHENHKNQGSDNGLTIYEPCDTTICCARQLKVCRLDQFKVEITDLGMLTEIGVDCDTIFAYPPRTALQCYNVCDYLKDFDELYPKIPPEINGEIHQDTIISIQNNLVVVSYNQFIFKLLIEQSGASNFNIQFFDILGNQFISKSGILKKGINTYEIDLSNLSSGVYLYNISFDSFSYKTGKIKVLR